MDAFFPMDLILMRNIVELPIPLEKRQLPSSYFFTMSSANICIKFFILVGVRASLCVHQLIPWCPKVKDRVIPTLALRVCIK